MKRAFDEISDDEWERHTFRPSRVLKGTKSPSPPPIETFAYRPKALGGYSSSNATGSFESPVNLDDDDEEEDAELKVVRPPQGSGRGRRFVVDDDSEAGNAVEVLEVRSTTADDEEISWTDEDDVQASSEEEVVKAEEEEVEEVDVVGKALQKCAKISLALRRELYGSSVSNCDRYAEVEACSSRIVTQVDYSLKPGVV
ncbi:hypothetical protein B296_00058265 [Ensete ventricosum]|uniref:Uncharacterized protein n=1 Tax=Ensete ventricosum TaxID=4639 RepID=A0A426X542_ENSVE|nr:hypothetical protein B296_00058265 [Ensete ventricosum]